jgi:hypothetical protein
MGEPCVWKESILICISKSQAIQSEAGVGALHGEWGRVGFARSECAQPGREASPCMTPTFLRRALSYVTKPTAESFFDMYYRCDRFCKTVLQEFCL